MGLAALGIVFGDIGTSPLYTLKTVLSMTIGGPRPEVVFGVLSLIVWTLIIITSVKYVVVAMSIDNDGEGGILALMSLLCIKKHQQPIIVAIGLSPLLIPFVVLATIATIIASQSIITGAFSMNPAGYPARLAAALADRTDV